MATTVRASSQNSATSGTAASVVAPTGTTTGDVVVLAVHFNQQTTIVDNNTTISVANLTAGTDTTDDSDSAVASVTVTKGKLQLLTIASRADSVQPTISSIGVPTGSGIVWTLVGTAVDYDASGSRRTLFLYRGMATATVTGGFTITWGGTQTAKCWNLDELTNVDTSGTQGSGAIVQSATNIGASVTSLSVTLGAFGSVNNATYGAFSGAGDDTFTAGSGFAITGQAHPGTNEISVGCEFKATNDTSVDISLSPLDDIGGIAVELKSAAATFTEDINDYKPNTASGHTVSIFSRRIIEGDPLTYNFTGGASGRWSIIAVTFQNPHATDIYDVTPSTTNADNLDSPPGSSGATAPDITTTTDNAIHCALAFIDASIDDFTGWPSGYTVQQSVDNNQGQTFTTKVITPAGATGEQTFTHNGSGTAFIGLSFAVKDIGGSTSVKDIISGLIPFAR